MAIKHKLGGIFSPVLTPFKTDLSPDTQAFVRHCQWLIGSEVGLAVFGTNSEANSLSVGEKHGRCWMRWSRRRAGRAHDAGHRRLRPPRHRRADRHAVRPAAAAC